MLLRGSEVRYFHSSSSILIGWCMTLLCFHCPFSVLSSYVLTIWELWISKWYSWWYVKENELLLSKACCRRRDRRREINITLFSPESSVILACHLFLSIAPLSEHRSIFFACFCFPRRATWPFHLLSLKHQSNILISHSRWPTFSPYIWEAQVIESQIA